MEKCSREQREQAAKLEQWKKLELECRAKLENDAKDLEKITNKQSVLLLKVNNLLIN